MRISLYFFAASTLLFSFSDSNSALSQTRHRGDTEHTSAKDDSSVWLHCSWLDDSVDVYLNKKTMDFSAKFNTERKDGIKWDKNYPPVLISYDNESITFVALIDYHDNVNLIKINNDGSFGVWNDQVMTSKNARITEDDEDMVDIRKMFLRKSSGEIANLYYRHGGFSNLIVPDSKSDDEKCHRSNMPLFPLSVKKKIF